MPGTALTVLDQSANAGFQMDVVPLSGRSSSEHNATTVREKVLAVPLRRDEPLILVGYSKGAVDILEALARYGEVASRVAAVISISGSINGSPLAAHYMGVYRRLLRNDRISTCEPGDGRVLESLEPTVRLRWLRYYSIVSFAERSQIARILAHPQRILSNQARP